jgi:hypothetical protein
VLDAVRLQLRLFASAAAIQAAWERILRQKIVIVGIPDDGDHRFRAKVIAIPG